VIIGIGTDLVQIERIKNSLERNGDRLARRVLTAAEFDEFSCRHSQGNFLAKRFAAKEALSKALKTGIGPISWKDIQVSNSSVGAPELELSGNALKIMRDLGGREVLLSLSDERDYALAFVTITS
jgi:holo-[acyl-carrier protein] synthase